MSLRRASIAFAAVAIGLATGPGAALAANLCYVTGHANPFNIGSNGYVTELDCPNDELCNCEVYGTNCVLKLSANVSTNSANTCLLLGAGVTFDLDGKSITCTGTDCGKAIHNDESSGSSSKVVVKNGTITGCFDAGIFFDASGGLNTDSSVKDMKIDLGSGCASGNGIHYGNGDYFNVGIFAPHGLMSRVTVKNADVGIHGHTDGDLEDSILNNNTNGFMGTVGAIDNVLFLNNSTHVWEWKGTMNPDISGSSFVGGTCDCAYTASGASNSQSCQAGLGGYCGTFQAPPSHLCDDANPANCSIEQ